MFKSRPSWPGARQREPATQNILIITAERSAHENQPQGRRQHVPRPRSLGGRHALPRDRP